MLPAQLVGCVARVFGPLWLAIAKFRMAVQPWWGCDELRQGGQSADQFLDHFTMHIRQTPVGAVVAESQLRVINAELVQDRRV